MRQDYDTEILEGEPCKTKPSQFDFECNNSIRVLQEESINKGEEMKMGSGGD